MIDCWNFIGVSVKMLHLDFKIFKNKCCKSKRERCNLIGGEEAQQHPSQGAGGWDGHSEACSALGCFLTKQSSVGAKSKGFAY